MSGLRQARAGSFMPEMDLTLGFLCMAEVPPKDILVAARAGGFAAASIRVTGRRVGDPWFDIVGNPVAEAAILDAARQTGVRISNVSGYYIDEAVRPEDLQVTVDITARLGASLIVQGCFEEDRARLVTTLRAYAAAAVEQRVRIGIEFMPFSAIKTLADGVAVVEAVGRDNVGLVVDALHLKRSGATPAELARAVERVPVFLAQICDAAAAPPAGMSLFDEAISGRRLPGAGALPLDGFLDALPPGTELECEVPLLDQRHLPAADRAITIAEATRLTLRMHAARELSQG